MKRSLLFPLLSLLASLPVSADVYTWTGNAGNNQWNVSSNWNLNNGYYPQSSQDTAIIGLDKDGSPAEVLWEGGSYWASTNVIELQEAASLTISGNGDLNIDRVAIGAGSSYKLVAEGDLGLGRDFTMDFGTFTADSCGVWDATEIGKGFWGNGHTITVTGVLDRTHLPLTETTLVLARYKAPTGSLTVNFDGLDLQGLALNQTTEDGVVTWSVAIPAAPAVPEPASTALGLLGWGMLALRRRRK